MNFNVEIALASGGRLGRISQVLHGRTVTLETPMCTLFTKGGSAPYLSLNMLEKIKHVPELATMSINSFVDYIDSIRESGKGLGEFTSMKDKLVFSTLHDASVTIQSGKNDKSGVAVWGKSGKTKLEPYRYMKIQESLRPNWLLALGDRDTDEESGEKRAIKSVDRTLDFLDIIVDAWKKSEALKSSSLIGAVVGGYSERQRQRSAKETSARPVHGFLLEGFRRGSSDSNLFDSDSFTDILSKTLSHLPKDKPRIMEIPWSPYHVIQAFKLGIDVFSSAYPHTLAEKGLAMTEHFELPAPTTRTQDLEKGEALSSSDTSPCTINLNDKRFFEDFTPVLEGCQCYTCATFTRSYIHHLLNTSELLAHVLLTIHNFESYFLFFNSLRDSIRNNRLDELERKLFTQRQSSK